MLIGFVVSERYLQYHMSAFWLYIDNGPRQFRDCACAVSQCTDRQKQSKTVKQQKMTIGVPIVTCLHRVRRIHKATPVMSQNFGDGHSLKRYAPELLAGVIFDVYDQHTQIITELDVKLNKRHITIEKLYRKTTETEQNLKKKL